MKKNIKYANILNIIGNVFLFFIKIIVGFISGSIALISDGLNSFLDVLYSIVIYITVKLGRKEPDKTHPFGHYRFEALGGLIVAIIISVFGFEIISYAVRSIIAGDLKVVGYLPIIVLLITVLVKIIMSVYLNIVGKKELSPALRAAAIDSRNDIFVSLSAIIGVLGNNLGLKILDPLLGIFIGIWVMIQGYILAKENIFYLTGHAPSKKIINYIKKEAKSIKGVIDVTDIKAHYVGNFVHVRLEVLVDEKTSLKKAHTISELVEKKIINLKIVDEAFVHIEPI